VLVLLMAVGVLVRTWFVKRHKGVNAWGLIAAAVALLAGLIVWMAPAKSSAPAVASSAAPTLAQVQAVIEQRCAMCHNAQLAQKGMQLHTPALIEQHAQSIYQQAVVLKVMPLNNATQITDEERALLGRWFEGRGGKK
jgi:uncharacterized membrane protein